MAEGLDAVFAYAGAEEVGGAGAHAFDAREVKSFQYLADVRGTGHHLSHFTNQDGRGSGFGHDLNSDC